MNEDKRKKAQHDSELFINFDIGSPMHDDDYVLNVKDLSVYPRPSNEIQTERNIKEYVFRKTGHFWEIVFEGNQLPPIKHLNGFEYYRFLFKNKNERYRGLDLYRFVNGTTNMGNTHSYDYRVRPGEENSNILNYDDFHDESQNMSIGIPKKHLHNAHINVYQCLKRAKEAIRDCGVLAGEKLWTYLDNTVRSKDGFVYQPARDPQKKDIAWTLE